MNNCPGGDRCLTCQYDVCDTINEARLKDIGRIIAGEIKEEESIEQLEKRFPGKVK